MNIKVHPLVKKYAKKEYNLLFSGLFIKPDVIIPTLTYITNVSAAAATKTDNNKKLSIYA